MALISVTPLARKGRVRATLVFHVYSVRHFLPHLKIVCLFQHGKNLSLAWIYINMARTLTPAFIFGNDYCYLLYICYYILFFQFPLLMLIPPLPVSFYGNTIQSAVDFYATVSSWMKYLFHCQNRVKQKMQWFLMAFI